MAWGGLFDEKTTSKSEQQASPWAFAARGLMRGAGTVTDWMGRQMEYFPGQTYAGQTPDEAAAIEQLQAGAAAYPGMHAGVYDPTMQAFSGALEAPQAALGMGLQDVTQNPALQGAAGAIQSRVMRNLEENILPQIRAGEVRGPAGDVARGIAARGTSDVLAEQLANLYGGAWAQGLGAETQRYTAGLGAQQAAMAAAPGMAEMGLGQYTRPAALLGQAGGLQRAEEQRAIDEAMARHQFSQMEPYTRATMGMQALMGPAQAFGTRRSQSETEYEPSTWSSLGNIASTAGSLFGLGGGLFGGMGGGSQMVPTGGGFGMYNNPWTQGVNPYDQGWGIFS